MIDIFGDGRHLSVNILGHAAGVLIFGIFLALMLSRLIRNYGDVF